MPTTISSSTTTAAMMPTTNKRIKTSNGNSSETNGNSSETDATQKRLLVPTFTDKNNMEELDLHSMTEDEIKLLQQRVRDAALSLKEVDYSEVSQSAHKVTRKTRVSFENHTHLVIDELFGNELDGLEDSELGELGDMLSMLYSNTE
ncbi:hypothetical protein ACHAXM_003435 [Skeletonema potamos]